MTNIDWKHLEADREAGTPGPWYHCHVGGWGMPDKARMIALRDHTAKEIAGDCPIAIAKDGALHWETKLPAEVNARRIARLPDLEAYALAAREKLEAAERLVTWVEMQATQAMLEGCCEFACACREQAAAYRAAGESDQ